MNKSILLHIDNETAKFSLNRRGSRSTAVHKEVTQVWQWLHQNGSYLKAIRISSKENIAADALSRDTLQPTEWTLSQYAFEKLQQWHGKLEVDLMATPLNNKLPRFICPFQHPLAEEVDAMTIDWNKFQQIFIFPPVNLLPSLLEKLQQYQNHGIIIAPWRPTAAWFPTLLTRCQDHVHLRDCVGQTVQGTYFSSDSVSSVRWTAFNF